MTTSMFSSATFSPCRRYRYELRRDQITDRPGRVTFIMLNPSTADETVDDPTIRRCMGFARDWGFGALSVVNLYAWRATDPAEMWSARRGGADIVGPDNDATIQRVVEASGLVIAAWGSNAERERTERVAEILRGCDRVAYCLKRNKDGNPAHPLYQPKRAERPMEQWPR